MGYKWLPISYEDWQLKQIRGKTMKVYYKILNLSAGVIARQFKPGAAFIEINKEYNRLSEKYKDREFSVIKVTEEEVK